MIKVCSKCGEERDAQNDFYKGSGNRCKVCIRKASKARYERIKANRPPKPPPVDLPTKKCAECGEVKDKKTGFYWDKRRDTYSSYCRKCHVARARKHYYAKREERLRYAREYWLQDQYGIDQETYECLLEKQGGVCALCQQPPKGSKRLAVDHCHATGKIRGLLCLRCNSALGVLGDNEEGIRRVLAYVTKECLTKSL